MAGMVSGTARGYTFTTIALTVVLSVVFFAVSCSNAASPKVTLPFLPQSTVQTAIKAMRAVKLPPQAGDATQSIVQNGSWGPETDGEGLRMTFTPDGRCAMFGVGSGSAKAGAWLIRDGYLITWFPDGDLPAGAPLTKTSQPMVWSIDPVESLYAGRVIKYASLVLYDRNSRTPDGAIVQANKEHIKLKAENAILDRPARLFDKPRRPSLDEQNLDVENDNSIPWLAAGTKINIIGRLVTNKRWLFVQTSTDQSNNTQYGWMTTETLRVLGSHDDVPVQAMDDYVIGLTSSHSFL